MSEMTTTQNKRGEVMPAIPLPFYGVRKQCCCGAKFWTEARYYEHYAFWHVVSGTLPL